MTRTKAETKRGGIAPNLSAMVACGSGWARGVDADAAAARELRALLAVARAAAKHMDACHYPPGAAVAGTTTDRLWNALARLARAGSGRRGT